MFDAFERYYLRDSGQVFDADRICLESNLVGLGEFVQRFGGTSFNHGLYRVVRGKDVDQWTTRIANAFPAFQGRITCFGYDWLGRAFAVDAKRLEGGRGGVLMFEPGAGQALGIPSNIETFHENELIEFREAALAVNFHREWLASGGAEPAYTECVGYRKALFLGGKDDLTNLELTDLEV